MILLGLGLGILNSRITSKITDKNHKLMISYVLSPMLAMMFITVYYAMSVKMIGVFKSFSAITISGFTSLMKGAVISPKVASFIFFMFFNSILLSHLIKENVKIKQYFYYCLAFVYLLLNKVLISAVNILVIK